MGIGGVRSLGFGAVLVLACAVLSASVTPQRTLPPGEQMRLEAFARERADEAAATVRRYLGTLHPDGEAAYRRWALVVWDWKRERGAGAGPYLVEGVLLDCLERSEGLRSGFSYGIGVDRRMQTLGLPERTDRAVKLFERALSFDSTLEEARLRAARIRGRKEPKAAIELEQLATVSSDHEIAYLAAISRAVIARDSANLPSAIRWFEHARRLRPGSTAAAIALGVLRPDDPVDFEALEPEDPYYDYPCRLLTPTVGEAFAARLARLVGQR